MHCLKQEKIDSSFIVCRLDTDNYFVIKTFIQEEILFREKS